MRGLYFQFSGLVGLLLLLHQLWRFAPIEKAIMIGAGAGIAVFAVLLMADAVIHRILSHPLPATERAHAAGQEGKKESKEQTKAERTDTPQAAAA